MDIRQKEHKFCLFTNLCLGHPWGLALSRDMGENPTPSPAQELSLRHMGYKASCGSHKPKAGSHTKPSSKLSSASERPDLCELQGPRKGQLEMRECTRAAGIALSSWRLLKHELGSTSKHTDLPIYCTRSTKSHHKPSYQDNQPLFSAVAV